VISVHCIASTFQRLQTKVIKIVDVSYGGENGFNQAIELASEALGNVKFIQEKKLIGLLVFMLHMTMITCNSVSRVHVDSLSKLCRIVQDHFDRICAAKES